MSISINELADEIMKGLEEYANVTSNILKESVNAAGKETLNYIKNNAPKNTGKYSKSWSVKRMLETPTSLSVIVHSKTQYQLTHLLEYGHAKRNGGRTQAKVHITPAEQLGIKTFENAIKRGIEK